MKLALFQLKVPVARSVPASFFNFTVEAVVDVNFVTVFSMMFSFAKILHHLSSHHHDVDADIGAQEASVTLLAILLQEEPLYIFHILVVVLFIEYPIL